MPCYYPLTGYRSASVNPASGKRGIVFNPTHGFADMPVTVPCGQCIGCRLEQSRQWAVRCVHEAQLHEENCFITLTYADEHLPEDRSLRLHHFQKFMKRLRKRYPSDTIRFYHCGEYGEQFGRPHYHAILFGFNFPDRYLYKTTKRGDHLYRSPSLEKLWPYGISSIGECTFESAAYVARYVIKKRTGDGAEEHYQWIDPDTGEIHQRKPEYTTMSRRPGIAHAWYEKFGSDVHPRDEVILRGKRMKPPKYYDGIYELTYPEEYALLQARRAKAAKKRSEDRSPDRLAAREKVQRLKVQQQLRRPLHDGSK